MKVTTVEDIAALVTKLEAETAIHRKKLERFRTLDSRRAVRDVRHFELRLREVVEHCRNLTGALGTIRQERERWHDMLVRESRQYFQDWDWAYQAEAGED